MDLKNTNADYQNICTQLIQPVPTTSNIENSGGSKLYLGKSSRSGDQQSLEESNVHNTVKRIQDGSTSDDIKKQRTYSGAGLKRSFHGNIYQLKLLMIFLKRGLTLGYTFHLATEWDDAEKFDDVVFKYTEKGQIKYRFLQAKHKQDEENKNIGVGDLLTTNQKGEFNLRKYFLSYLKIKNNVDFQDCYLVDFIICTNIDFAFQDEKKQKLKVMISGKNAGIEICFEAFTGDDIFFKDGGARYKLSNGPYTNLEVKDALRDAVRKEVNKFAETITGLKEKIKNLTGADSENASKLQNNLTKNEKWFKAFEELKQIENEENTKLEDNIKEFFEISTFAVDQPNEMELVEIIKLEFGVEFDATDIENIFCQFLVKIMDWMKEKDGRFLSNGEVKEFIEEFRRGIPIWFNIRKSEHSFTGRDKQLEQLHKILQSTGKSVITAVSGLGGVGKSELARKYLEIYRQEYDETIVWVNAESYQTLVEDFKRLAKEKLSINLKNLDGVEKNIKSIVEDVHRHFLKRKSLFIFDNAQNYKTDGDGIDVFLPPKHTKCRVLITSRNKNWENLEIISLDKFTDKDAADFIRKVLGIEVGTQECEIKDLAETLQNFPLALQLAVAYIKERDVQLRWTCSKFDINDYLERYKVETKELLNFKFPDDSNNLYTKTTYTTWQITVDQIAANEKYGEQAVAIFNILAYFWSDSIPVELFLNSKLINNDKVKLGGAIELLKKYSMVSEGEEQYLIDVHRLVQEVTRLKLKEKGEEERILENALHLINSDDIQNEWSYCPETIWSYACRYGRLIDVFFFESLYSEYEFTPLHMFAARDDCKEIILIITHMEKSPEKLLKAIHSVDLEGNTFLHIAARNGNLKIVKYLIGEKGLNCLLKNADGDTPLHLAAFYGKLDIMKYLIDEKGVDPNVENTDGDTPLHHAATLEIVKYLIDGKRVDDINHRNKIGNTPLHSAASFNAIEKLKYLIEKGGDCLVRNANGVTVDGIRIQNSVNF